MKTNITIITGFLGSGKTTLIKKMLSEFIPNEKIALIENEFGETSIDSYQLSEYDIVISEITSGCICCNRSDQINKVITDIKSRFPSYQIVIEASGVAKLSDLLKVLKPLETSQEIAINHIITVVAPARSMAYLRQFKSIYRNQIEFAQMIILSKTQTLTPTEIEAQVNAIRQINPYVPIIKEAWDTIRINTLMEISAPAKSIPKIHPPIPTHTTAIENTITSIHIIPHNYYTPERIFALFHQIRNSEDYGFIARIKGYLPSNSLHMLNIDYMADGENVNPLNQKAEVGIHITGIMLNKQKLEELFQ